VGGTSPIVELLVHLPECYRSEASGGDVTCKVVSGGPRQNGSPYVHLVYSYRYIFCYVLATRLILDGHILPTAVKMLGR